MESNNLLKTILGIVITIILIGTVLMSAISIADDNMRPPSIESSNKTSSSRAMSPATTNSISFADGIITVDGREYKGTSTTTPYLLAENAFVVATSTGLSGSLYGIKTGETSATYKGFTTSDTTTVDIVNGIVKITVNGTEYTCDCAWSFIANPDGDFCGVSSYIRQTTYYKNEIYAVSNSGGDMWSFWLSDDGLTATHNGNQCTALLDGEDVENTDYKRVNTSRSSTNFRATDGNLSTAPYYTVAKTTIIYQPAGGAEIQLIHVIPVIVIVSLLAACIGGIMIRARN